ncbi:MAG TPA: DEAD/DEAH box helicase [Acidimicrobiales bacterium]|nr:DEAD/DEAH box helicase [Acidimicrobiales bacterium]
MLEELEAFHPAVRSWFERRFPEGPTPPQLGAWPAIARGEHTLVAAPTGSGKTLSGFLVAIDQLYRAHEAGEDVAGATRVVYVSPLKALGVDIQQNLETPLREIAAIARDELHLEPPPLRVEVRNGDTPPSARQAMLRRPPTFLVTTPESLYLLVTSEKGRRVLEHTRTVIVDEIHAVARDKRGSHLALTLERLDRLCRASGTGRAPTRIGLSATQRPIETVARLLVGAGNDLPIIVDAGHQRDLDLAIELPDAELEAVASNEQFGEILERIAAHVLEHRTTIVFVNTRRLAERVAHLLSERLGDDMVASHHGSLSKERRLRVETRLRAGELRALVATASLELGIDIGPVELVCQIGSPRSLATFLQRVGRSGHTRAGTPKGRLYPLTRDELIECLGLLAGVRAGHLDAIHPPEAPLDILAQHVIAETSAERWSEDDLFDLVRRAAPFAALSRADFDEVLDLVTEGIETGRGRRGAYVHRDKVNRELEGRRGARLAATTSGGAIPETADYRVIADPDDTFVGTVNEDWAIESSSGDVFLLGSTSWRIRRVEPGVVRVVDANGAPPTVPFWLGEAPARTDELSGEVSAIRAELEHRLRDGDADGAVAWLMDHAGVDAECAAMAVRYLAAARLALGRLPTTDHLVFERFFDETGGMQLVVHAPFGGRINRGLGLSLRKRFCVSFDFELQAAASDDAVVLSLGPQHSFPLDSVARFLASKTVEGVLRQAVLVSPMFTARWRWNLNRSLVVLRYRGGRRNPPPIQRMESDDLMAAVFPKLVGCQENVTGPIEIPDHPLVRQTMHDCLTEAMDIRGLERVVEGLETGRIAVTCVDTTEPSPLSHEILSARPYTFLDDAPLEERRTRAVQLRRGLPVDQRNLGALDPDAIERVRVEAAGEVRTADELCDLLASMIVSRPRCAEHEVALFGELVAGGRALVDAQGFWIATESIELAPQVHDDHEVAARALRGHLEVLGPVTVAELEARTGLGATTVQVALASLENDGFALRGRFDPGIDDEQFCARRLLARIHGYTQKRLRREVEPVTAQDFLRFLLRWHHVTPDTRRSGRRGLLAAVEQLQGFELSAGAWEQHVLPARIEGYRPELLDSLCMSGDVAWGRLGIRPAALAAAADEDEWVRTTTSRATPVALLLRNDLAWLLQAARGDAHPTEPTDGPTAAVLAELRRRGALFHAELAAALQSADSVEDALWDGVARGLLTADGFGAVRSLLSARDRNATLPVHVRRRLRRGATGRVGADGRWCLLPEPCPVDDPDELAEAVAEQLLARWGVVFRDLVQRETLGGVLWRDVLHALRRMEARGTARGGRFVTGFTGEQFALPDAVDALRRIRKVERTGERVTVCGADPLNLVGVIVPGPRVAAVRTTTVTYVDGRPEPTDGAVPADLELVTA